MIFSTFGLFKQRLLLTKFLDKISTDKTAVFWGKKHPKRIKLAHILRLPLLNLEDGFLRSVGLGVSGYPPYSIVYDDIGIYYDTTRPSRLEQLILAAETMPSETLAQARQAMNFILQHHLSKYNHAPELSDDHPLRSPSKPETVLIIDQTFGDMAIQYGGADASTFELMFQTALNENPQADIWVKTHPDVLCGKKQGYLTRLAQQHRVHLLAEDINPISLLQNVDKVYCVTSQMGFEALLCGKPLTTFGLPWYAGWGVNDDRHPKIDSLVRTQRRAPATCCSSSPRPICNTAATSTPIPAKQVASLISSTIWQRSNVKTTNCVASCIVSACLCGNARLPNHSLTYPLAV